jgi:FtsP/CotA-like multicopper oxidase with cupredoxin domain
MTDIGAPGDGPSRRDFLKATGAGGLAATAGCTAPSGRDQQAARQTTQQAMQDDGVPYTSPPEIVNVDEQGGEVSLKSVPAKHAVHPEETMGGPVEFPRVWAFQADDGEPSVPGPILRTTEGEDVQVTLDNTDSKHPHTLHFHGSRKTWENDGVPTTTGITVKPGEKHTYEIPANVPGTHLYHCHYQTQRHMEMGMFGIFRVDPKGYEPADREYFLTLKDWDSSLPRMMAGEDASYNPRKRNSDVFTINGKAAPRTLHPEDGSPIIVTEGETVRLHMVNAGYMSHPMHTHNHRFTLVEKDGGTIPEAARHEEDVTSLAPAERHVVEFEADADPGIYPLHCHKVNHVMNGRTYPGGMLSAIVYESAMDSDIFAELMAAAGYEG